MKARTLLKKLTDHGLEVKQIGENIRLSPSRLINDKVLTFVRTHKNDLLCALHDEQQALHRERKLALRQGRIQVCQILLKRFLNDAKCRELVNFQGTVNDKAVEDHINAELRNFDYDLEAMIDMYRTYAPLPNTTPAKCIKCGYRPRFCSCKEKSR